MVLNWEWLYPPAEGDVWRQIDLVVTTGGGGATGLSWVKAKDAAKHPTVPRTAHHTEWPGHKCQQKPSRNSKDWLKVGGRGAQPTKLVSSQVLQEKYSFAWELLQWKKLHFVSSGCTSIVMWPLGQL